MNLLIIILLLQIQVPSYKQSDIEVIKYECNEDAIHAFCPGILQTYYLNDVYFILNDISLVKGDWLVKTKSGKYFICDGKIFDKEEIISSVKCR